MKIGILTTTYNRKILLTRLYETLLLQNDCNFTWCVVDDGSVDKTSIIVDEWVKNRPPFEIRYFYIKNGGKSRAINYGFTNNADIDFFAIIDSDDYTIPQTIKIIREKAELYLARADVGAIFFRYMDGDKTILTNSKGLTQKKEIVMTRYEYDATYSKDDGCIGYYNRTIKKYRFPEYNGENYVGPIVLQMLMAKEFKIAFCLDVIGVAEYQEGGLTKTGRKLRINNPLGMIHYCGLLQSRLNKKRSKRIKYAIEAQAYAILSPYSREKLYQNGIKSEWLKWWARPFGFMLSQIWQIRHGLKSGAE